MRKFSIAAACLALCVVFVSRPANALTEFKKAFEDRYSKKSDNKEFQDAVKKQSCNVCHVKGEKKDVRNAYGEELAKLVEGSAKERIDKAGDAAAKKAEKAKLVKEIEEAFKKVEEMKSDPEKEDSETFGQRLKSNKLPIDPPAASGGDDKEEPEEEEEE